MWRFVSWLVLATVLVPSLASALDASEDPAPWLRWGMSGGVMGTLPLGDDVGQNGARDEFERALWVDLDVLSLDLGEYIAVAAFARFVARGGVNVRAIDDALDPTRRVDARGKPFPDPDITMLQLGLKLRYFPFAHELGRLRPFVSLGSAYATTGAHYQASVPGSEMDMPGEGSLLGGASSTLETHRHQGLALIAGLGLRFDLPIRVFHADMLVPLSVEAQYIKNFWLGLEQRGPELHPERLAKKGLNLDFVGLALTVGFLR